MKCPKCSSAMRSFTHQAIEVERCQKCGGLWFDMLEAEDLKKLSGSEALDTGQANIGKEHDKKKNIKCPVDSAVMIRMVVAGQPHISYESCPVCYGTYFDAGEFKDFKAESFMERVKLALGIKKK